MGYAIFSTWGNYRSVHVWQETVGGPRTIKSTAILLPGCVASAMPRAKHCFSHQRSVEIHQLHSVCSLIFFSKCQGNKKSMASWPLNSSLQLWLQEQGNKGSAAKKWGGNSFIPSYLLAVRVVQMFSIIKEKCQTMREACARNMWVKGREHRFQKAQFTTTGN